MVADGTVASPEPCAWLSSEWINERWVTHSSWAHQEIKQGGVLRTAHLLPGSPPPTLWASPVHLLWAVRGLREAGFWSMNRCPGSHLRCMGRFSIIRGRSHVQNLPLGEERDRCSRSCRWEPSWDIFVVLVGEGTVAPREL